MLKGNHRARLANLCDLWAEILERIEKKRLEVEVYWIPSRTDTQPKKKEEAPAWMKERHVKGNSAADALAIAAVRLHEIPKEQADRVTKYIYN